MALKRERVAEASRGFPVVRGRCLAASRASFVEPIEVGLRRPDRSDEHGVTAAPLPPRAVVPETVGELRRARGGISADSAKASLEHEADVQPARGLPRRPQWLADSPRGHRVVLRAGHRSSSAGLHQESSCEPSSAFPRPPALASVGSAVAFREHAPPRQICRLGFDPRLPPRSRRERRSSGAGDARPPVSRSPMRPAQPPIGDLHELW